MAKEKDGDASRQQIEELKMNFFGGGRDRMYKKQASQETEPSTNTAPEREQEMFEDRGKTGGEGAAEHTDR